MVDEPLYIVLVMKIQIYFGYFFFEFLARRTLRRSSSTIDFYLIAICFFAISMDIYLELSEDLVSKNL